MRKVSQNFITLVLEIWVLSAKGEIAFDEEQNYSGLCNQNFDQLQTAILNFAPGLQG
jgi:hypothetical protein